MENNENEKGKIEMNETNKKGITIGALVIIAILIIALICSIFYILKLIDNKELENTNGTIGNVNNTNIVENVNSTVTDVNSNVTENKNDNINDNKETEKKYEYSNSDKKDIKATIENYYKLLTAKENSPVLMLTDVMGLTVESVQDPEYAPDNFVEHPNPSKYIWTGIKYNDFINELWYISDDILEKEFTEFVKYKDYLYIENNDNNSYLFKYEITKNEISDKSTESTCICNVTVKNTKTGKTSKNTITMNRGNGDFVITKID